MLSYQKTALLSLLAQVHTKLYEYGLNSIYTDGNFDPLKAVKYNKSVLIIDRHLSGIEKQIKTL